MSTTLLHSVEQRLSGLVPASCGLVGSAMALAAITSAPPQVGVSVWVVPLAEVPNGDMRSAGPALQKVAVTFGVMLAVRVVNSLRGMEGAQILEDARAAIRSQLFGWTPANALVPCLLGTSELVNMENGVIWWMDKYTTAVQYRAPQN